MAAPTQKPPGLNLTTVWRNWWRFVEQTGGSGRKRRAGDPPPLPLDSRPVLTPLPCGRLGNRLFQISNVLSIGLESGGLVSVALPDIPLAAEFRDVAEGLDRDPAANPHDRTVWKRLAPLRLPPEMLGFDLPLDQYFDEQMRGRCRPCTIFQHSVDVDRTDGARIFYGASSCYDEFNVSDCPGYNLSEEVFGSENWAFSLAALASRVARQDGCSVVRFAGGYQDMRYLANVPWLRSLFWDEAAARNATWHVDRLSRPGTATVAIHMRLGLDFLFTPNFLVQVYYYVRAIRRVREEVNLPLRCIILTDFSVLVGSYLASNRLCDEQIVMNPHLLDVPTSFFMLGVTPISVLSPSTFSFWSNLLAMGQSKEDRLIIAPILQDWRQYLMQPAGPRWVGIEAYPNR